MALQASPNSFGLIPANFTPELENYYSSSSSGKEGSGVEAEGAALTGIP